MTKYYLVFHSIRAGLILLTLLASLLLTTSIIPFTYAAPPNHVPDTQYSQYPMSTVGRLVITLPRQRTSICSGTAMTSLNGSVVDTAAHCFFDPTSGQSVDASNVQFCPQYHSGISPYGCWRGQQVFIPSDYQRNLLKINPPNDFALLVVALKQDETRLQNAIGRGGQVLPQSMPLPKNSIATAYGYPGVLPYNGRELYSVTATVKTSGLLGPLNYEGTIYLPNSGLETGASGGPWFVTIGGIPFLVGHQSTITDNNAYSPNFKKAGWFGLFTQAILVTPTV